MTVVPDNDSAEAKTVRHGRTKVIVFTMVVIVCCATYYKFQNWRAPYREDRALGAVIWRLADHRPADMTPKQWESAVAWTVNLHCNSLTFLAPADSIRQLRLEIESKLDNTDRSIDIETIHWIWDSYANLCPAGDRYQRFRKQMTDEIESGGGNWGIEIP